MEVPGAFQPAEGFALELTVNAPSEAARVERVARPGHRLQRRERFLM